ncbi:MAG: prolyl oligopeptidase family serine peptidase [Chthoniobacter sp.]|nr:prolyl oligopeptidase family serine peptidase [Chthoniobacter sp.]
MFSRLLTAALALFLAVSALAAEVKPIPPPGIPIPDTDRAALTAEVAALGKEIEALRVALKAKPEMLALLPDVMIFHKSVDWALRYDEFFEPKHLDAARQQLALGRQRAKELRDGQPSWNSATGLVVRGYISKIDGSVQPYGLVIPDDWKPGEATPRRLDFWLRGRSEKATELGFLADRMKSRGEFAPPGAIMLHPFGRYCCANKFAGEVDLFEALENARTHYGIDPNRISVRGFSMGGASTWHLGTHFAGLWAAVAPGAGFAETAEYNHVFAAGKTPPPWWEQVLYRWYDATLYAANLANTTTVAYSGEIDGQKQAADIMLRFAEKEGLTFPHIIGPQTAHKYHPDAKPKIEEIVTGAAVKGRDLESDKFHFVTYSLIYPMMKSCFIIGLGKEWERAEISGERSPDGALSVATKNVSSFILLPDFLEKPMDAATFLKSSAKPITIDGQPFPGSSPPKMRGFEKVDGNWRALSSPESAAVPGPDLRKKPFVCGPIDHAFMSNFLFVRPTGKPLNNKVGAWAAAEMEHAIGFWRKVFRGDVRVKDDTALTAEDVAASNLILWGDPGSNAALAKILARLPLQWTRDKLTLAGQTYDATQHAPILIYPNPANPSRYIVLNSGVTFREEALLTNAQQTPKLPDWAVIDLRTPPDTKWPGLVLDAGFFDETWQWPKK